MRFDLLLVTLGGCAAPAKDLLTPDEFIVSYGYASATGRADWTREGQAPAHGARKRHLARAGWALRKRRG